jgi:putative flavoprotein involved in K+ transport
MPIPHDTEVLILGAGPAGLAMGRELSLRSIPYLILDKEDMVGSTFVKMTESTTFGPWLNNTLPGSPMPLSRRLSRTTRADYARYLREYAVQHQLNVQLQTTVQSAHKEEHRFVVHCAGGACYRATYLVNATGIFSKPNLPYYPVLEECDIPYIHSADYRSPATVRSLTGLSLGARVLIVGSRLSAGEIMQELHEAGHQVAISHREPIETWPSPLEEALISPFTYLWEGLSLRMGFQRPTNLQPRLRRGRQWSLLTRGKVQTRPAVVQTEPKRVVFSDGRTEEYDLLIFATGYRPALDHLQPMLGQPTPWVSGLEAVEVPNLFFLGLTGSRTFRSEFLRGIREDVPYLGEVLQQRRSLTPIKDLQPQAAAPLSVVSSSLPGRTPAWVDHPALQLARRDLDTPA